MARLKGITVKLFVKNDEWIWDPFSFVDGKVESATYDPFGYKSWVEQAVIVPNVLVAPVMESSQGIPEVADLTRKKSVYKLGIPKGDTHDWENCIVELFGKYYRTVGPVIEGIEANVPGPWHKIVTVERYED